MEASTDIEPLEDVDLLNGAETLGKVDPEFQELLKRHQFQAIAEKARKGKETDDPEVLAEVSDRLNDFSIDLDCLAQEQGVPYYPQSERMGRLFESPGAIPEKERVYNLLGHTTLSLAVRCLRRSVQTSIARNAARS